MGHESRPNLYYRKVQRTLTEKNELTSPRFKDTMKIIWHILKISATGMIDIEPFLAFYQSSLRLWHQKMTNFGLSGISDFMRNHGNMLSMGGFRNRSQSYTFERMRMSIVKCGNQTKLWDSWTVQFYLLKIQQNWVKM